MSRLRAVIAVALVLLVPVLGLPDASAGAQSATRIPLAEFEPLPAAADRAEVLSTGAQTLTVASARAQLSSWS